ncbi:MAG TPA: response regulator [Methylomirabilota bacterium]|jgi:two-component system torCAD operon response regulator TorR
MAMQTQSTPRPIEPSLLGRRILVVEDHPDSRDLLTTSFRLVGARVLGVPTVAEAQRGVDRFRPDLVVCDLKLPDGTGLDFTVWLRARPKAHGRDTPCIALTGFDQHFPPDRAIGFDAYMRKPADLATLCNIAAALIGRAQS